MVSTAIFAFAIGYWVGSGTDPHVPEPIERRLAPDLFSDIPDIPSIPEYRFVEADPDTVIKTRTDTVKVPVNFGDRYRVTEERPITMDSREVHFRYYAPDRDQHEVERFEVPEPVWDTGLSVGFGYIYPQEIYQLDVKASLRYRRVEGFISAGAWHWDRELRPVVSGGVRVGF